MLAQKGEDAAVEVHASEVAITALGGRVRQLVPVELRGLAETRHLVVVDKVASTPDRYPRRPGIPKKRPIRRSPGPKKQGLRTEARDLGVSHETVRSIVGRVKEDAGSL